MTTRLRAGGDRVCPGAARWQPAATIQLPALHLTAYTGNTTGSSRAVGAIVKIRDTKCGNVVRSTTTNSVGRLANPGLPFSDYDVCVQRSRPAPDPQRQPEHARGRSRRRLLPGHLREHGDLPVMVDQGHFASRRAGHHDGRAADGDVHLPRRLHGDPDDGSGLGPQSGPSREAGRRQSARPPGPDAHGRRAPLGVCRARNRARPGRQHQHFGRLHVALRVERQPDARQARDHATRAARSRRPSTRRPGARRRPGPSRRPRTSRASC